MIMTHPGLAEWALFTVYFAVTTIAIWFLWQPHGKQKTQTNNRVIGSFVQQPWLLLFSRVLFAVLFLLIIYAGLFGTPIAERNIATVLTWNLWWAGLIFQYSFWVQPGVLFVPGMLWLAGWFAVGSSSVAKSITVLTCLYPNG
jgi:nicotinamide riboside transporter PnuC